MHVVVVDEQLGCSVFPKILRLADRLTIELEVEIRDDRGISVVDFMTVGNYMGNT